MVLLVLSVFGLAIEIRRTALEPLPTRFHPVRYYVGAVHARRVNLTLLRTEDLQPWKQAWLQSDLKPILEPPVLECLTILTWLPDGQERLWVAAVINSVLWIIGGGILMDIVRRLTESWLAGIIAAGFFLHCPLGVMISMSFQPETLAVVGFLSALWLMVLWPPAESWFRTIVLGLIAGACLMFKPGTMFLPFVGAAIGLRWGQISFRQRFTDIRTLAFIVIAIAPSVLYAMARLNHRTADLFTPELLTSASSYMRWFRNVDLSVGWVSVLAALLGAVALAWKFNQYIGVGLLLGYLGYSFAFFYFAVTHDYYQTPLTAIAAVCLGGLVGAVSGAHFVRNCPRWLLSILAIGVVCGFYFLPRHAREVVAAENRVDFAELLHLEEIGELLPKGTPVIAVDPLSSYPLIYHNWLLAHTWPRYADYAKEQVTTGTIVPVPERLASLIDEYGCQFFLVIDSKIKKIHWRVHGELSHMTAEEILPHVQNTDFYDVQLMLHLRDNYPVYHADDHYIIYDLRSELPGQSKASLH